MKKNRIVIYVSGGLVQGVSADRPEGLEVVLIDQDNINVGDHDPRASDASLRALCNDKSKGIF